jgi:hypothetical protein
MYGEISRAASREAIIAAALKTTIAAKKRKKKNHQAMQIESVKAQMKIMAWRIGVKESANGEK